MRDPEPVAAAAALDVRDLRPDLPPQVVSTGLPFLVVAASDREAVARARRDSQALRPLLEDAGADGMYLFAVDERGAKARMFDVALGIGEDPATGSAAGTLGAFLAARGVFPTAGVLSIQQGEEVGRPCLLQVEVQPEAGSWRVLVSGGVHVVGRGTFDLP